MFRVNATSRENRRGDRDAGLQLEKPFHRSPGAFSSVEHPQRCGVQHVGNGEAWVRLARQTCGSSRFFKAADGEMCVG